MPGLLQVLNLDETLEREEAMRAQNSPQLPDEVESGLTSQIRKDWETAKMYRVRTDAHLLSCLRARRGMYSAEEISRINAMGGANMIWMDITDAKCRQAKAWIEDVVMPIGEKPWGLEPSPIPDLPDEVKEAVVERAAQQARAAMIQQAQQGGGTMSREDFGKMAADIGAGIRDEAVKAMKENAEKRAERMEQRIGEHMVDGDYRLAMADFIDYFVTYPAAVLKGPFFQHKDCIVWDPGWEVGVEQLPKMSWVAVNPFDCYPAPNAVDCQKGAFIERMRLRRDQLYAMIGLPGYKENAIRGALTDYRNGHIESWLWSEMERRRYENDTIYDWLSPHGVIDALHYWGSVPGQYLMDWGMEQLDPVEEYEIDAILIGRYVIRASLNAHPLKRRPYHKASFSRTPGAFWGRSVYDLIKPSQKMCNAFACAMADNAAMACLTGDTVVYRQPKPNGSKQHYPKAYSEVTLNELWERKNRHKSGLKRSWIRSLDEATGKFIANRIVDIFDNGVRPVYEVKTELGYRIKATLNHRFMRDTGDYQHLENFKVGDLIAVNGSAEPLPHTCLDCGKGLKLPTSVRCRSCACRKANYKPRFCLGCGIEIPGPSKWNGAVRCRPCFMKTEQWRRWNTTQAERALSNRDASETTARHRKLVRQQMKAACEMCGTNGRLLIHHLDKDPMNCDPSNLMTLCHPCHHEWHRRDDTTGDPRLHTFLDYDRIVSIEYNGEERVFDLQMEAPNHNFIANGCVSHNSAPMLWMYADRLAPGYTDINPAPWKVYQLASNKTGSDSMTNPGIGYIPIPSIVNDLATQYAMFRDEADMTSGIPKYFMGDMGNTPEVARTMAMMLNTGSKGLQQATVEIDLHVIEPTLIDAYLYEMMYGHDISAKGDCNIIARGTAAILVKDAHLENRKTVLQLIATNPQLMQLIGMRGLAEITREVVKLLEMPVDKIVPSDAEIQQREEAAKQATGQDPTLQVYQQVEMQKIAAKEKQVEEINQTKIQIESMKEGRQGPNPEAEANRQVDMAKQQTTRDVKAGEIQKGLAVERMAHAHDAKQQAHEQQMPPHPGQ